MRSNCYLCNKYCIGRIFCGCQCHNPNPICRNCMKASNELLWDDLATNWICEDCIDDTGPFPFLELGEKE